MIEWKLRGYVTPEDLGGNVQAALDQAEALDIRKVVLSGNYQCEKLVIPAFTHIVLEGTLKADLFSRKVCNYSFEQERIYIQGGKVEGNLYFYNCRRVTLEDVTVTGTVTYEFCRDLRMERCTVEGGVQVGRGCAVGIFQQLQAAAFAFSTQVFCGDIVPAKEPDIKNIVLRDSVITQGSVTLEAGEDCGIMNVQVDHITAPATAVILGKAGVTLPAKQYFNLTLTDLTAPQPCLLLNETKHTYL